MKYVLFLLLVSMVSSVRAQKKDTPVYRIRGQIRIENIDRQLANATVALFGDKDASIVETTFSDTSGVFVLDNIRKGEYKLHITYVGCQPVWFSVNVTSRDSSVDLGIIFIKATGIMLGVVEIINEKPPMVVRKDTLEFNAGSFKTKENDIVEELLRKLPGVWVERDGTIKVNGEVVKKLLVDGRPFFGDDPKTATRNLPADIIEKIQFVDRKSDWSQFTGINDGKREKTINIVIKKDKRDGYFGRLSGAWGTDSHFAVNSSINQFNEDQQFAIWANGTDINGYQDNGGQSRISVGGNSGVRNWTGGASYSKGLGKKVKIGANYSMSINYAENKRNSRRKNMLPDTSWCYIQDIRSVGTNANHALNVWMELRPDTTYMLNVSANLGYATSGNVQEDIYTSLNNAYQIVNNGTMRISNALRAPNVSVSALLGKKFKKVGRTLSIDLGMGYNTSYQEGGNRSENLFVKPDGEKFTDSLNQQNSIINISHSLSFTSIYTEPVGKSCYIEMTYMYSNNYGTSDKSTYDYNHLNKKYDRQNDSLSNTFVSTSSVHQGGIRFLIQKDNYDYSIGLKVQSSELDNNSIGENSRLVEQTKNFFPSAAFNYAINGRKRIQLSYSGATQQPSITQLQPVPDNSTPLYLQLGNPNLKPSFGNSFSATYTTLNPGTLRNFSVGINSELVANKIVNASWFDSLGRQVSLPQNVNGSYSINTGFSTNFPLKRYRTSINTSVSIGYDQDVSYINGVKGGRNSVNVTPGVSFSFNFKDLFGISTNASASYSRVGYTAQMDDDTWFLNYRLALDGNVSLPLGVSVGWNLDYACNTGKEGVYGQSATVLNVFISKSFFKHRAGTIRLQGLDLLNRNVGITRVLGANYVEDLETIVMQRLFLISFSYSIKGVGDRK